MATPVLEDDLNDSLDTFYSDFGYDPTVKTDTSRPLPTYSKPIAQPYSEPCKSCSGTGQFRGYSGRIVGTCFKCKGTGTLVFKLSPEKRQAGRAYAAKRQAARQEEVKAAANTYAEQHPEVVAWLAANQTFEFAISLQAALTKFGHLTEGQEAAVIRIIEKNKVRDAERAAQQKAILENAPEVSIEAIETSFDNAKEKGIKRPKLRLDTFKFSLAPMHGVNAGAIYVNQDEDYLGKIKDGKFIRFARNCDEATEQRVVEVCADPKAAAIAYGKRYGRCSCCGKELTNHASIELGIGPICAEKYGW